MNYENFFEELTADTNNFFNSPNTNSTKEISFDIDYLIKLIAHYEMKSPDNININNYSDDDISFIIQHYLNMMII